MLLLSHFSRVWLCDTIDSSTPGSPVPGILQARTLEWVAISFSNAWKWKVKVKSLSHVRPSATPWTAAFQAPLPTGFSKARVLEWGAIAFYILILHPYSKTHLSPSPWRSLYGVAIYHFHSFSTDELIYHSLFKHSSHTRTLVISNFCSHQKMMQWIPPR